MLEAFADWDWFECEGGGIYDTNADPESAQALGERLGGYDGLGVCHGCPTIDAAILDQAPGLKIIGELEGDRFASRIDVEAAWTRGVCTVDTTNGSSYPVSEWALALIIISLRNAGAQFPRLIAGDVSPRPHSYFGFIHAQPGCRRPRYHRCRSATPMCYLKWAFTLNPTPPASCGVPQYHE